MLSLDFAYCSPGKVWGRVRFPMSHIVGCDDSKLRNCNTCLLKSARGITARSFIGVIYHPIMEKIIMNLPDVTIVHLAPERFNCTVSAF